MPVAEPERFLRPGSPFLICCISRKDGVQIKFPRAMGGEVGGYLCIQNKAVCNFNRVKREMKVCWGVEICTFISCGRTQKNIFRKLAFLKWCQLMWKWVEGERKLIWLFHHSGVFDLWLNGFSHLNRESSLESHLSCSFGKCCLVHFFAKVSF